MELISSKSLLTCSFIRKQEKIELHSSSQSTQPHQLFSLIHDDLLTEILRLVPSTLDILCCKLVCKRWYSLISNPYFINRFLTRHINHDGHRNSGYVVIHHGSLKGDRILFSLPQNPNFESRISSLKNLFNCDVVRASASCNDLLLCIAYKKDHGCGYYICNPFTSQWNCIPNTLNYKDDIASIYFNDLRVGFICEPYCRKAEDGEYIFNSQYSYRVLRIYRSNYNQIEVDIYCSETRKWTESALIGKRYLCRSAVVPCNGKLYWYNEYSIVACDPFNIEQTCFIGFPKWGGTERLGHKYCLGSCRGLLRIMALVECHEGRSLAVWKLKEYETREWIIEQIVGLTREFTMPTGFSVSGAEVLAFHPNDEDIVYLGSHGRAISCDLRRGEVKIAGELKGFSKESFCQLWLRWWPTPILEWCKTGKHTTQKPVLANVTPKANLVSHITTTPVAKASFKECYPKC